MKPYDLTIKMCALWCLGTNQKPMIQVLCIVVKPYDLTIKMCIVVLGYKPKASTLYCSEAI